MQTLLFYACCFTDRTGYYKPKLPTTQGVSGYRWVCLSRTGQLPSWGLAVSLVSLPQTCCFYRRHTCATSAFCASEAVHRKVCWLTCCVRGRKDRRLNPDLHFALVSELAHVPGLTDTYGLHCTWPQHTVDSTQILISTTIFSTLSAYHPCTHVKIWPRSS